MSSMPYFHHEKLLPCGTGTLDLFSRVVGFAVLFASSGLIGFHHRRRSGDEVGETFEDEYE